MQVTKLGWSLLLVAGALAAMQGTATADTAGTPRKRAPAPRLSPAWTTPPPTLGNFQYPTGWRKLALVPGGDAKRRNCCKDPCGGCWTVEGRRLARKPDKWTWIASAAVLGGAAALFIANDTDLIEEAGDITQIAVPVIAGGMAGFKRDWRGLKQFGLSLGGSVIVTQGLKEGVGRWRPNESNAKSFPSGHTMAAFAGASFIYTRYGAKWGIPAYLAAGFVGASRIHASKHFADDVLAGASIAMMMNWLFVKPCGQTCRPSYRLCERKARFAFEFGAVHFSENEVTSPRDTGTTIDFADFQESDRPAIAARASVEVYRCRQEWMLSLSPNEYRDVGTAPTALDFGGTTIPAGTSLLTRNLLHDYRLRWRYDLTPRRRVHLKAGVAAAIQDATVEILDANTGFEYGSMTDTILLPVAHLHVGWQFARDWLLYWEADAGLRTDYQSLETSLFCRWQVDEYWDIALGGRFSDGKIDTPEFKNTWQASTLVLQFGRSFYRPRQ